MSTGSLNQLGEYRHLEVVQIVSQPAGVREPLAGSEGFVLGCSDPLPDGQRYYGVHVNHYGQTFGVPGALIRTTGRVAAPADVRSRGGLRGRSTHPV